MSKTFKTLILLVFIFCLSTPCFVENASSADDKTESTPDQHSSAAQPSEQHTPAPEAPVPAVQTVTGQHPPAEQPAPVTQQPPVQLPKTDQQVPAKQPSAGQQTPAAQPTPLQSQKPGLPAPAPQQPQPAPAQQAPQQTQQLPFQQPPPVPQMPGRRFPQMPGAAGTAKTVPTPAGVSFFFDDANLNDVVQTIFGEILKVNYIIDPKVQGRVTFRTTTPIPNADVMFVVEIVLRINGATVIEDKGIYKIIPIGTIPKEPAAINFGKDPQGIDVKGKAIIQIVPVEYASSTEMVQILTPFLSQGAVASDIQRKNYLIIADTDVNVRKMLSIVQEFDKDTDQINVYTYPLQSLASEIAIKMLTPIFLNPSKTGKPFVTPGTNLFADENSNAIIILASYKDYKIIEDTLRKIDIMPPQVLIEATIAQVALNSDFNFGVDWFLKTHFDIKNKPITGNFFGIGSNPLPISAGVAASSSSSTTTTTTGGFSPPLGGLTFAAVDKAGNIRGLIEALESRTKVKVISSPNILATNNKEARILIGTQVPIVTSDLTTTTISGTTTGTVAPIQRTIQYKDTGNILKVKPQIKDGGLVTLEVSTEVSTAHTSSAGGIDTTTIDKTEVSTTLIASDNQTIVMGGFIQENKTKTGAGIPLLSRIPLLGYLFGHTEDKEDRNELIVLLTPHIIKSKVSMDSVTEDFIAKLQSVPQLLQTQKLQKR